MLREIIERKIMNVDLVNRGDSTTETLKHIFGKPSRIPVTKKLYQDFVTVIGFVQNWKSAYLSLSKEDKALFDDALNKGTDSHIKRKSKDLMSALIHVSFAKKGYEKLIDIVLAKGTDEAHETLESLQEIFEEEINIMNATKYEFTMPSPSSTLNRRPAGRNARAPRPVGRG